jgi:serine/threonine-protein kinase RsbW
MTVVGSAEAVIRVAVPARADVLHLLRSVTATVGARMSMPLDDVEELRIAVDEAATLLLDRSERPGGSLQLELTCMHRSLRGSVRLDTAGAAEGDDDVRGSWPWRVISGMTDEASIERSDGGMAIVFAKTTPGSDR